MPRECKVYLKDILEAIRKIEKYTEGQSFNDFRGIEILTIYE